MTLESIEIPADIKQIPHSPNAASLIETGHGLADHVLNHWDTSFDNLVPSNFRLVDQALTWIHQKHLLTGQRFCELGSGFGVATMLASLQNMESVGIEIESELVEQACQLADRFELDADFYCGSFIPRDINGILEWACETERVVTDEDDVYDEIGLAFDDFDLFFTFPWPGDRPFFESVFDAAAATNALLLMYDGRNGMQLMRKI